MYLRYSRVLCRNKRNYTVLVSVSHQLALITSLPFTCVLGAENKEVNSLLVTVKLLQHQQIAGTPLKLYLPNQYGNTLMATGNDSGYGDNDKDWATCSQVPHAFAFGMQFTD